MNTHTLLLAWSRRIALLVAFGSTSCLALPGQAAANRAGEKTRSAKLRIVVTLPIFAHLARIIGGEDVVVRSLGKPAEDPHQILPTPSLMTSAAHADVFLELGLSLELWAERVLDGAHNPKIRRGGKAHVFVGEGLPVLEIPSNLSRSEGDLHPGGNPHLWMDPVRIGLIATNIERGMARIDPARAETFAANLRRFQGELDQALYGETLVKLMGGKVLNRLALGERLWPFLNSKKYKGKLLVALLGGWMKKAEPLRGKKILFYHKSWVYFARRFGLVVVDHVEEKPGIVPPASHKQKLLGEIRADKIRVVAQQTYYDDAIAKALARETGIRVVILPGMVEAVPEARDVFAFVDSIIDRLLVAYKGT